MQEPSPQTLVTMPSRLMVATRPGFLTASAVPVLIGLAVAGAQGGINWVTAIATLAGAMIAHAGSNVLNDYFDAEAGCDEINDDRVFPFTGGSRVIQNGVLSPESTRQFGWVLMGVAVAIGLVLTAVSGPELLAVGLAGIFIGWAYSAPPLRLSARGLGELGVAIGFGSLIPLGTVFVQTGTMSATALLAGLPFALLIALVLYINQFPDLKSDATTGKRNWVVRLGADRARAGYILLAGGAYLSLLLVILAGVVPYTAALAFLALPFHLNGGRALMQYADNPKALRPAIEATLRGTMLNGLLFAAGISLGGLVGGA